MSCDFAHLDGVYVLGALAAGERAEYERHLPGCEECSRALRDLAGLPGLLGRVPLEVLEQPEAADPVPETLLPAVVAEASRPRGRRTAALVAAAVVALLLATVGVTAALVDDTGSDRSAAPSTSESTAPAQRLTSLGNPSTGWVSLTEKAWGTRIDLTCTYDGKLTERTTYVLVVQPVDGAPQQVGTWEADLGQEVHLTMATSVATDDIATVEVQTESGYQVLRLER